MTPFPKSTYYHKTIRRHTRVLVRLIVSFLFAFGFVQLFELITPEDGFMGYFTPIVSPIVLLGAFSASKALYAKLDRRIFRFALFFSVLFCLALVLAVNVSTSASARVSSLNTWIIVVSIVPLTSLCVTYLLKSIKRCSPYAVAGHRRISEKKWFAIAFFAILASWLPLFFIEWPGVWNFDAPYQTLWISRGDQINAYHPVLHTLWLSIPLIISFDITGSYIPGCAFYTLSQMVIGSLLLAGTALLIRRWNVPQWLPILTIAFFACFPCFALWSVISTKDVAFSYLFSFSIAQMVNVSFTEKQLSSQNAQANANGKWAALFISLLFTCLFRNNMAYGIALFVVFALIILKRRGLSLAALSFGVIITYALVTGPISSMAGILPGGKQEMMSVPAVQLASVAKQGEPSEEELRFIATYVPDYSNLDPTLADPVKNTFNTEKASDEPFAFAKGYIKIGLRYPEIFLDSFLRLSFGFWSPIDIYDNPNVREMGYWFYGDRQDGEDPTKSGWIFIDEVTGFEHLLEDAHNTVLLIEEQVPVLSSISQVGFWLWAVILLLICCLFLKKRKLTMN